MMKTRFIVFSIMVLISACAFSGCVERQDRGTAAAPHDVLAKSGEGEGAKMFTSFQYGYKFVIPKGWSEADQMTKLKSEDLYARSNTDFETYFEKPSKFGELSIIAFVKNDLPMTPGQFDELIRRDGFNGVYGVIKAFYSNALPMAIMSHDYDTSRHLLRVNFKRNDYDTRCLIYPSKKGLIYVVSNIPQEKSRAHTRDLDVIYYSFKPLS